MSELSAPTPRHLTRGKRVLQRLVEAKLATPAAVQAVLNLVDPFPDENIEPVGWPDGTPFPVVPVCYKNQVTLSAPAGLAAGATWDAHILMRPFPAGTSVGIWQKYPWTMPGGALGAPASQGQGVYMFDVATAASGSLPAPDSAAWSVARPAGVIGSPEGVLINGPTTPYRVCAMGIEAINTSAQLYKGGMGYAYRIPSIKSPMSATLVAGTPTMQVQAFDLIEAPPTSPADIINLANTYSGPCDAGVVCVGAPIDFSSNDFSVQVPSSCGYAIPPLGAMSLQSVQLQAPTIRWETGGIFLTGLAQNASFTIRYRVFGEIASLASSSSAFMQAIGKSGVPYSPAMIQLLTEIGEHLPAGFDYRENPFGEWFSKILSTIGDVAPTIGAALSAVHPVAGAIVSGIGSGAKAIGGITQSTMKKVASAKQKQASSNGASSSKAKKSEKRKTIGPLRANGKY